MQDDLIKDKTADFQGNPKPSQSVKRVDGLTVEYKDEQPVTAARMDLLRYINKTCKDKNLQYFAFGALLTGIIHYESFIPDGQKSVLDIGLLRKDYDIFIEEIQKTAAKEGIVLDNIYPNGQKKYQIRIGKTISIETDVIRVSDIIWIYINPFDFVPEEYDSRKGFFRKIERLNNRYTKLISMMTEKPGGGIGKSFLSAIRYAFAVRGRIKKIHSKIYTTAAKYKDTGMVCRIVPKRSALIEMDKLFPLKMGKIGDLTVCCPNDYTTWTAIFNEELMLRTKEIQKVDLLLLKEFDRVCRKIGVGYFICGGTMLGYKRHNGFIPWDDDIDVGMLRADYNKFLKEGGAFLSEDFFLQTRSSNKKNPYLFSKIRMNGTEYITKYNEKRDFHKGICLDIFPFDFIPNKPSSQMKFRQTVRQYESIHNKFANRQIEKVEYPNRPKSFKDAFFRSYNDIRRRIVWIVPLRLTHHMYTKKATKFNDKAEELKLNTVASFVPTYTWVTLDNLLPYKDIEFEGVKTMAINNIEAFLTMQYGDYMELPMSHQRVGHDLISWSVSDEIKKKYNLG